MTPTNASRAERARRALVAYKGNEPGAPESGSMIIDLMTDLHHVLNEQNQVELDVLLDDWLRVAHSHFIHEKK